MKRITCFLIVCSMLFCLAGCAGSREDPGRTPDAVTSAPQSTIAPTDAPSFDAGKVDFGDIPAMDSPLARIYSGADSLLFEYVTPGMDTSDSTLIHFSLTENKTLGKVVLGNGVFSMRMNADGGFSVFDAVTATVNNYSADCTLIDTRKITCLDGELGFILPADEDQQMLVSDIRSGGLYLISADGTEKTAVDLQPGLYEAVGQADGRFVVMAGGQDVLVINQDGSVNKTFSKGGVSMVNKSYAAGRIGDHLVFLPLERGDWTFTGVSNPDETLVAAGNGVFLTMSAQDDNTTARLYRMTKHTLVESEIDGAVAAAAITPQGQIAVICRDDNRLFYQLIDPSGWTEKDFATENDLSAVIGAVALPDIGERDELDVYTKEIVDKYNVRFLYEPCEMVDAFAEAGITARLPEDRALLLRAAKQLVNSFAFLPDPVWRDIGGDLPYVVMLCQSIPGNLGGLSFELGGYNCVFVEITGNDAFYTDLFMHETGHAIGHIVKQKHPEMIEEWLELTPKQVRDAVEKGTADGVNALTVEFTPDDPDGNVCYVTPYAMTSPEEDRAETLAKLYNSIYAKTEEIDFSREVLQKKTRLWGRMIRAVFPLQAEDKLPFDGI